MDIMETIKDQIENNRVILYMKGSPISHSAVFSAYGAGAYGLRSEICLRRRAKQP